MGGSRGTVDALLGGAWEVRPSGKKVPGEETVFYSSSDLEMIVHFRQDRAVGVNVIVPSGPNGKPIDGGRYRDLVRLLGAAPKDADVRKEGAGILEFKVGEM
jgi:hypothetical protein